MATSFVNQQKLIDSYEEGFMKFAGEFTKPLTYSLEEQIMEWQALSPDAPLANITPDYLKSEIQLLYATDKDVSEYILINDSLLPAIIYYLK